MEGKERYYYHAAKRFMMDAQMLRYRAAIHVENRDDVDFWSMIFNHYRPQYKFHFISGSRNENGRETRGVTQCLKYLPYLSSKFFICIDSDYRYLLHDSKINVNHFVFQTYTYSFENHLCFAEGLNDLCHQITRQPNTFFDFRQFLQEYSKIIHELFLWHIYFIAADANHFPMPEFNQLVTLEWGHSHPDIRENGKHELDRLRLQVKTKVAEMRRRYPKADLSILEKRYHPMGLTPENTYLFIRGHNIYYIVYMLIKEVCKRIARQYRESPEAGQINFFSYRHAIDAKLKQHLHFGEYEAIRQIEKDINLFF